MNSYSLPDIFAFIFNVSFAIRLFSVKREKKIIYWLFFIFILFSLWNVLNLVTMNLSSRENALFCAQITYRILFLLPAFILSLSLEFLPSSKGYPLRFWLFIIFIVPVLLLALSFPDFNLRVIEFSAPQKNFSFALTTNTSPYFYSILLLAFVYIVLAVFIMQKQQKKLLSLRRKIFLRTLIYGLISLFFLFLFIHLINNNLHSYSTIYLLKTVFLFVQIFFSYVILNFLVKEQQWEYSNKILSYLIFTILVAVYFIFIKISIKLISDFLNIHNFYFDAGLIFLLTLFFQPVEVLVHKIILQKIKGKLYTYRSNFLDLTNELIEIVSNEQLLDKVRKFIQINFRSEEVYLFRLNEKKQSFESIDIPYELETDSIFIQFLKNKKSVVEFSEFRPLLINNKLSDFFVKKDIQLLLPIQKSGELFQFLIIGHKDNGIDYSHEELEILSIFSNEIGLYLHRNYLYEKVQAEELEKFRLEKLAALGQLTAGIAHEIRNPLNTISVAAQTLQQKDTDESIRKRMATYIEEEVNRLNGLVSEFLELSRMKKPNWEDVDLEIVMTRLTVFLESKCKDIKFYIENNVKTRFVSDSKFIYQILTNLSINAIEALNVRCRDKEFSCADAWLKIKTISNKGHILFTVSNNGPRISGEVRERIFEPFFTTKEDGTGLGLSLVENMVKNLSGTIIVKSSKTQTQFIIKIPLKK